MVVVGSAVVVVVVDVVVVVGVQPTEAKGTIAMMNPSVPTCIAFPAVSLNHLFNPLYTLVNAGDVHKALPSL